MRDNSPSTVVVVVDTDNSSLNTGPLKFSETESALNTGIVVVVVVASFKQFVFFLNFPTLLFEPKASVVVILALYLAPSGTPEIVVMDTEEPAGILYVFSVTFLLFTNIFTLNTAETLDFLLFMDIP